MTVSKYKRSLKKKLHCECGAALSILRKENSCLKNILTELFREHSQLYKLVQAFLCLEMLRLESYQPAVDEDQNEDVDEDEDEDQNEDVDEDANEAVDEDQNDAVDEDQNEDADEDANEAVDEDQNEDIDEDQNEDVDEDQNEDDSSSDEQPSYTDEDVTELRNQLIDALEKNRQWLEYDQKREANAKAVLDRMLWLENYLNEANQARSQQHNEAHSDVKEKMAEMQEHYEKLLQKAKDELEVLREQLDVTQKQLITTQNWCKEKEKEVEALRQQLDDPDDLEDEEEELRNEPEEPQSRLDKEKRSVRFMMQKLTLNRQVADQKKIEDLQRQIKISTKDLEDVRQDCLYLKKLLVKVLKMLHKNKEKAAKESKEEEQAHGSCEVVHPTSRLTFDNMTSTPRRSLLEESFLECPKCQAEYPATQYQELLAHIDVCDA
ncbi:centrosomal protein of 55 kDa-like [Salarias fasciatus]|uniref:centrosomal protein of 55 kDa-like n=1 Tax=Salarias fasciatus TaxID=181472 RepID=UPI001176BD52|nr:centrosomal protein of 55 kDa-like [Salarias fasciatus]